MILAVNTPAVCQGMETSDGCPWLELRSGRFDHTCVGHNFGVTIINCTTVKGGDRWHPQIALAIIFRLRSERYSD
jgi:hypothetical protein